MAIVLFFCLLLCGCQGFVESTEGNSGSNSNVSTSGNGSNANGSNTTNGTAGKTYDDIHEFVAKIGTVDQQTFANKVLAFLKARDDVADAAIGVDFSISAELKDGTPILILNNEFNYNADLLANPFDAKVPFPNQVPNDKPKAVQDLARSVPRGKTARLFHTFTAQEQTVQAIALFFNNPANVGRLFVWADPRLAIKASLEEAGYTAIVEEASLANLRKVRDPAGDAVMFWNTHGAPWTLGPNKYYIMVTSELLRSPLAETQDAALFDDLQNRRILKVHVPSGFAINDGSNPDQKDRVVTTFEWRYAFTPLFAKKYFRFCENSFLFSNACFGFTNESADMRAALFDPTVNLSFYVGWDNSTERTKSSEAAAYIIDRLAGGNKYSLILPPNRPHEWRDVEIRAKELGQTQTSGPPQEGQTLPTVANMKFERNPNQGAQATFDILRPSIRQIDFDEANKTMTLNGIFGTKDLGVTINDQPLQVLTSSKTSIKVASPSAGGAVRVINSGHASPARNVYSWTATASLNLSNEPGKVRTTFTGRWRQDTSSYRLAPDGPTFAGHSDSKAFEVIQFSYDPSMDVVDGGGTRILSSSNGTPLDFPKNADANIHFNSNGTVDLSFFFLVPNGVHEITFPSVNVPNGAVRDIDWKIGMSPKGIPVGFDLVIPAGTDPRGVGSWTQFTPTPVGDPLQPL